MANELVKASLVRVPVASGAASLPVLVERAGGAARYPWLPVEPDPPRHHQLSPLRLHHEALVCGRMERVIHR